MTPQRLETISLRTEVARALVVADVGCRVTEHETNTGLQQIQFRRNGVLYNLTLTKARTDER